MDKIWVVGPPKCGNTWLSRLLGSARHSRVGGMNNNKPPASEGEGRGGKYFIIQEHMQKRETDDCCVVVYRDPRDAIVSAKFYWKMNNFDNAIDGVTQGKWPYARLWSKYIDNWIISGEADAVISYEALKKDTAKSVKFILNRFGIEPVVDIKTAVQIQSFATKKKFIQKHGDNMPYGKPLQSEMLRKGIIGDWKNHLTKSQCKIIHDRLWPYLYVLGYEKNPDWWKDVER